MEKLKLELKTYTYLRSEGYTHKQAIQIIKQETPPNCKTCRGYGLWPIGQPTPIGPTDAKEWRGMIRKCPECGAGDISP